MDLKAKRIRKGKQPTFVRHTINQKKRLAPVWRRPKGLQNKMRLRHRGYLRHLEIGWGTAAALRGIGYKGLREVLVGTVLEINALDPKKDGAILRREIGSKRRLELLEACEKKKITVLNLNATKAKETITAAVTSRKKAREERAVRKTKKAEVKTKSDQKKAKDEEKASSISEEEQKAQDKKEYDKKLIHGQ